MDSGTILIAVLVLLLLLAGAFFLLISVAFAIVLIRFVGGGPESEYADINDVEISSEPRSKK